jgi:hydrogenase maturation protease
MNGPHPPIPILMIGYGNELRGDDAVGPHILRAVEDWQEQGVQTCIVHQLTPELSEDIARAEWVLFVDACRFNCPQTAKITLLDGVGSKTAGSTVPALGHTCDPQSLLTLTHSVYGHRPKAWRLAVPAVDFSMGEHLSATAKQGIKEALGLIRMLIASHKALETDQVEDPLCTK